MKITLNSRDRLLTAMHRQEPDHVPLWNLWRNQDIPFRYHSQVERAEAVLELGLDDTLLLEPPLNKTEHYDVNRVAGISYHVQQEQSHAGRYPLLVKEYFTPRGNLKQVVSKTEDWLYGDDIRLFSDQNISRSKVFPVKGEEDLAALQYLLSEPTHDQIEEFRQVAFSLRKEAQRLGVMLEGGWTALGDAALWLLGPEQLLYWQMDSPELLEELLDILLKWELLRMELLLDEGVDVIVHSAWYESTNFWTPKNYHKLLKPRLKEMVNLTHQAGKLFSYIITAAWLPLSKDLLDLEIDSLIGVDPVQDKIDLLQVKQQIGKSVCLYGGLNGALTLGHGSPEEVREATRTAIQTLGPGGGFVLYPVDQLVKETPWSNVQSMIACWNEFASYPIQP